MKLDSKSSTKTVAIHKIEMFLKSQGLTKKQLFKILGINKNTFYKWRNGMKPSLSNFEKLQKLIPDLEIEDFLTPFVDKLSREDFYNEIYQGDALEWLRKFPDNSVHLVVTSPPYNAGHDYDGYDDNLDWNEYKSFLKEVLTEVYRVLVKGGRLAINIPFAVKNRKTKKVKFLATAIAGICEEIGYIDFEFILWHKGKSPEHFQGNNTAWGSWKSPSNPVFRPLGEAVLVFSKEQTKLEGDRKNIDITAEEFKDWTKNVWYLDGTNYQVWFIPNTQKKNVHPCPFPEELVRRLIKIYTYKGDIVLDPFNGIGTTTKVAKELDRKYIGIDLSEEYCKIARERIRKLEEKEENRKHPILFAGVGTKKEKKELICRDESFKKLVNPSEISLEPVNRWFFLKESFSGSLVKKLLYRYNVEHAKTILDPFMGAGSTLYKGYELGKTAYGFDVNPISKLSVEVKTANYTFKDIETLNRIKNEIKSLSPKEQKFPKWTPLPKYISPDKLNLLLTIKEYIENLPDKKISNLLKLLWLSILEKVSDYKKDGNGIKFQYKNVSVEDVTYILIERINMAIKDIKEYLILLNGRGKVIPFLKSSMQIESVKEVENVDVVITSPPYMNMFDYFEVYKIELWMGGFIKSYEEWRKYKKLAMRNNANAFLSPQDVIKTSMFSEIYEKLNKKVKEGEIKEKRVPTVVANYFYDMRNLLRSLVTKKLNRGATVSIVVGNSAYGGVVIPTDEIIAEIGQNLGYSVEEILVARQLRTSSQQMKKISEKDRELLRESIVTLRKVV